MILNGDARNIPIRDESIHCVVTNPPYWGLRDYGLGKGAIGLEPTIDLYVEHIVEIFREVRRVLRKDGTVWGIFGDSFFGDSPPRKKSSEAFSSTWDPLLSAGRGGARRSAARQNGLKPKDLCMIPHRVALALQADGWWIRMDIVWSKPNPMPESITDRHTKAHEYVFLMSRSAKYFYDANAIREPWTSGRDDMRKHGVRTGEAYIQQGSVMDNSDRGDRKAERNQHDYSGGRNRRSVWEIPTQPFPEGHFATFPENLILPCILAGTSAKGACSECGAPWVRVVERDARKLRRKSAKTPVTNGTQVSSTGWTDGNPRTSGWKPSCKCDAGEPVPCVVFDPFGGGSGRVHKVAFRHGRRAVMLDLSEAYCGMTQKQIHEAAPLFM